MKNPASPSGKPGKSNLRKVLAIASYRLPIACLFRRRNGFDGINAHFLLVPAPSLIADDAVDEGEQRIVAADADIGAGMDLAAPLADENVARKDLLTVAALGAEALRFAVAAVMGRTGTFFMSE